MSVDSLSVTRQNTVVVCEEPGCARAHLRELQHSAARKVSIVHISCSSCNTRQSAEPAAVFIVQSLLQAMTTRTKVGCFNLPQWLRYRNVGAEVIALLQELSEQRTYEQLSAFLASRHREISSLWTTVIAVEQSEFALLVLSDFEEVDQNEQPDVAGIVHRLVKGAPAYFQIIAMGKPNLFRRDGFSEVGIQLDHDYIQIDS